MPMHICATTYMLLYVITFWATETRSVNNPHSATSQNVEWELFCPTLEERKKNKSHPIPTNSAKFGITNKKRMKRTINQKTDGTSLKSKTKIKTGYMVKIPVRALSPVVSTATHDAKMIDLRPN